MNVTRLITLDDAPALAELLVANRDFLAPWEPDRGEEYFTVEGQRAVIREVLQQHADGSVLPHVILGDAGAVVGRITLNGIVRGCFQSCSMGYWVSAAANGRGLATGAVGELVRLAFDELGLHRVQAETLPHNVRSQRVLARHGFVRYGLAPAYLKIAGRWQDHVMFQKLNPTAGGRVQDEAS
ncbi:GNAT family N-acetyltransferase [Micromonospora globispora]|nr:GNAT family N-acetyltransferase [Micromonospora globispora]RQX01708.1 GNAT family N-acetyltransferase [Micromonospora globispora]